jgi:multidrug transporter EmrE-like cation transporter
LALSVPALAFVTLDALAAAWPFVVASVALHAFYFYALSASYGAGDFSRVYPIARGLGVALVPVVAYVVFGERLAPLGILGIALVVTGIVAINLLPRRTSGLARPRRLHAGTGWALVTGLAITAYSVTDKGGVMRLPPLPYIALMGLGTVIVLIPAVARRAPALREEWRINWRAILAASTTNLSSYLLVLFAFRLSKAGYVVAARELSPLLRAARQHLARRGAPCSLARGRRGGRDRCRLRRHGALTPRSSFTRTSRVLPSRSSGPCLFREFRLALLLYPLDAAERVAPERPTGGSP